MTFYIILKMDDSGKYEPLDFGPDSYMTMKYKMQELRKENSGAKYKLLKTNY